MTTSSRREADGRRSPGPGRADEVATRRPRGAARPWLLSAALAVFALLPLLARLAVALAGGPPLAPADAGTAAAVALAVHAVAGTLFTTLGAFQFPTAPRPTASSPTAPSPEARRGRGAVWHPRAGRLLVPLGLVAGLSALWLTLFHSHPDGTEPLLFALRLLFGAALVACVVAGLVAIRGHHVPRHRAWMLRAYALGLGASTQIVTLGFGGAVVGDGETSTALLTGAGWVINLAVAEWVIRSPRAAGARRPRPARPQPG